MGLTKDQKNLVKSWVAAGYNDRQIVKLAEGENPPFHISQQNISKNYRKKVEKKVQQISQEKQEEDVLRKGLAVKEERIQMLERTANYLFEMVPRTAAMQLPSVVNAMRGCLDDIAKELGQRKNNVDVNANLQVQDITAIVNRLFRE